MPKRNQQIMLSPESKSGRACDNCVRKKARWYCAADDAFLCQSCDSSVHSANPLARRHERVRLKTHDGGSVATDPPSWHKRKARTPRQKKKQSGFGPGKVEEGIAGSSNPLSLVPEISGTEEENEEEHLLYRVPIFDPFVGEMCSTSNEGGSGSGYGFAPSEMDLAEFAADVESLLGKGLEEEVFDMEGLGILDERERDSWECCFGDERERVKVENEEEIVYHEFMGLERETFELNFDYDEDDVMGKIEVKDEDEEKVIDDGKKIFLRLDYQGVISAWDDHKSPWMTGKRPDLDSDECWPHCMDTSGTMHVYGDSPGTIGGHVAAVVDGGRQARVSRYREKRRTRLFSKKIRYEVRKLNAEKRPRMKGRFVKRANLVASPALSLLNK